MSVAYYLEETYQNLKHHKLRSILTGVGVTWGIFILVILLGAGEGFANGVMRRLSGFARNVITCYGHYSPERGKAQFKIPWIYQLRHNIPGIQYVTPVAWIDCTVSYQKKHKQKRITSADVCYHRIAQLGLGKGRFFNDRDALFARPVCVIGDRVNNDFFKDQDSLGRFLNVQGTLMQVVGILDKDAPLNNEYQDHVLVLYQVFARLNTPALLDKCYMFKVLLEPEADAKHVEKGIKIDLAKKLQLSSSETDDFFMRNVNAIVDVHQKLFRNIRMFLWLIGILILLNGIVGVSNMMLVAVHERTQELGIRKILGASARETRTMILSESICISLVSGIIGIACGMAVIYMLNGILDYVDPGQTAMMAHLSFKLPVALAALGLVVMAGALAGIVPARRAMAVLPIKALQTE